MNTKRLILVFVAGLLVAQVGAQQAPAGAPPGTSGLCNDGTYYSGASKKGACTGHKGVKEWYGASATAPAGTSAPAPAPASTANPAPRQSTPAATSRPTTRGQAPGGGPGMVWVNTATNVYHCPGTRAPRSRQAL